MRTLLVVALALPVPALACSCAMPSTKGAADNADVVFRGTVIAADGCELPWEHPYYCHRLTVDRIWKGDVGSEAQVATDLSSCAHFLEPGKEYLVYARTRRTKDALLASMWVGGCSGTKPTRAAAADLAFLGPGWAPAGSASRVIFLARIALPIACTLVVVWLVSRRRAAKNSPGRV